jgi:hypothetical protein
MKKTVKQRSSYGKKPASPRIGQVQLVVRPWQRVRKFEEMEAISRLPAASVPLGRGIRL